MKTIKNIAGFFFISLFLSGCIEPHDIPTKTEKGKAIYNSWHKGVDTVFFRYVNIAFAFNTWYEADDSQKNSIEDAYLSSFKIRDLGDDQWGLYYGAELAYQIQRQNKSLSDTDAVWIVVATNATINMMDNNKCPDHYYSSGRYDLVSFLDAKEITAVFRATTNNEWDIQVGYSHYDTRMSIHLKSLDSITPITLFESSFACSMKGEFGYKTSYEQIYDAGVYFETTKDLVFHPQNSSVDYYKENHYSYPKKAFYWSSGKVTLTAKSRGEEVKTEASFNKLTGSQYGIYITYKGITEEWIEVNGK